MSSIQEEYSEFGHYVYAITRRLDKLVDASFREHLDITFQQFSLMRFIQKSLPLMPTQQLIAQELGIAKSAVSRHSDILRGKKLITVTTSSSSRREHVLAVTRLGAERLKKAKHIIQEAERIGFGDLPPHEVRTMLRVLEHILIKLEQ